MGFGQIVTPLLTGEHILDLGVILDLTVTSYSCDCVYQGAEFVTPAAIGQRPRGSEGTGMSPVLGNDLTKLMYFRELTDREVASRSGLTREEVNRIRNGRSIPRARTAIAIAGALNRRVEDIFYLRSMHSHRSLVRSEIASWSSALGASSSTDREG